MSAPRDDGPDTPRQMPRNRARLLIILTLVLVAVVVVGYLLLVGGTVGD